MVTAFFDDHDEPLTIITTPLFSGNEMLVDITKLFSQESFEVYFFDENNYELLGATIQNEDFNKFSKEINTATFPQFQQSNTLDTWKSMELQFGLRTANDDSNAYNMKLDGRLYPDDMMIIDARNSLHSFNDQQKTVSAISLEREGDPGPISATKISIKSLFISS